MPARAPSPGVRGRLRPRRVDAKCGLAAYYAGLIHTALGSVDEAERELRRARKLMAPDRRPIEALKDLEKKHKR